jgi:hypothetical protein
MHTTYVEKKTREVLKQVHTTYVGKKKPKKFYNSNPLLWPATEKCTLHMQKKKWGNSGTLEH